MSLESIFLNAATAKLNLSTERIATCLGKLNDDQIWARGHENENAAGNLVLHLAGNVRQWIIHGLGGQPDIRVRDREFAASGNISAADLMERLKSTVAEATSVISGLSTEQLTRTYNIQDRTNTGLEVIFHVVEHFGQHTGQIIFLTKAFTSEDLAFYMPRKPLKV